MRIIGLTGNIGSGKSLAASYLGEFGAALVDADQVGHSILEPEGPAYQDVLATFGLGIRKADQTIDRQALATLVFADSKLLTQLNQLTHPRITETIRSQIASYKSQGYAITVLEAALLFDSDLRLLTDENWLIAVSPEISLARTVERDHCSRQAAEARLQAQRPLSELKALADRIFFNDGSPEQLRAQMAMAYQDVLAQNRVKEDEEKDRRIP